MSIDDDVVEFTAMLPESKTQAQAAGHEGEVCELWWSREEPHKNKKHI